MKLIIEISIAIMLLCMTTIIVLVSVLDVKEIIREIIKKEEDNDE